MKKITIAWFAAVLLFAFSIDSHACACCAEPGTYSLWTGKPDSFHTEILQKIEFDENAYLYMTEAGFDTIKGLSEIERDFNDEMWVASPGDLKLTNSFASRTWKFSLKTKSGRNGILTLPMPAQMLAFKVDIHDGKTSGGGGPLLYKEFRFKGTVHSGTGFFQGGIVKPTGYFLVLKGRGNGCDNSEDFTHWYLEIRGKKASYEFFGKLSSANPAYIFDENENENEDEA